MVLLQRWQVHRLSEPNGCRSEQHKTCLFQTSSTTRCPATCEALQMTLLLWAHSRNRDIVAWCDSNHLHLSSTKSSERVVDSGGASDY